MLGVDHMVLFPWLHPDSRSEIEMQVQYLSVLQSPLGGHLGRQVQRELQGSAVRATSLDDEETKTMNCIYPVAQAQETLFSLTPCVLWSGSRMF